MNFNNPFGENLIHNNYKVKFNTIKKVKNNVGINFGLKFFSSLN